MFVRLAFESETEEKKAQEDDGVKYGLLVEGSRGQVMRVIVAAAHGISLVYPYFLCWVSVFFLGKNKPYCLFQLIQIRLFLTRLQGSS